jgi:hypothetical protein
MQNDPAVLGLLRFAATHRRHVETLAQATGEHFNIFRILHVGHLEVKSHSPILGELLNPKGHHAQDPYRYWKEDAWEGIRSGKFEENLRIKLKKLAKIAKEFAAANR